MSPLYLSAGQTVRIPGRGWHTLTDVEWNGRNVVVLRWGRGAHQCEPFWLDDMVDVL